MNPMAPDSGSEEIRLDQRIRNLPREMTPARDLWPGISARLALESAEEPRRTGSAWIPVTLAAAVILAVCSALGGAALGYQRAARELAMAPQPASGFDQVELAYTTARASYFSDLALSGRSLDPDTRDILQRNLRVIDVAAQEVRAALVKDPDNQQYFEALLMTRDREMDLLAEMTTHL